MIDDETLKEAADEWNKLTPEQREAFKQIDRNIERNNKKRTYQIGIEEITDDQDYIEY